MVKRKIAVLMTCHNRREKTLACLESLFKCSLPEDYQFDVYLVDDGSTDGTGLAVREIFSQVTVIEGDGNLFWNGGMRLAWQKTAQKYHDFYLWLNDDTYLKEDSLYTIFSDYYDAFKMTGKVSVITGACNDPRTNEFSYGGRTDVGVVIPNGQIQSSKYINGNIVLVPKEIYRTIGMLSPEYTHGLGDFDYGLRAKKAGFECYTTSKYVATCEPKDSHSWCDPDVSIKTRFKLLYSPKGLNLSEYLKFRKKYWGWKWIPYAIKAYLKVISPKYYESISKFMMQSNRGSQR